MKNYSKNEKRRGFMPSPGLQPLYARLKLPLQETGYPCRFRGGKLLLFSQNTFVTEGNFISP